MPRSSSTPKAGKSGTSDLAAAAAALGAAVPTSNSASTPTAGAAPKSAASAAASAAAPAKLAPIQVKLQIGSIVACVPKFMPTEVYVQQFDQVKAVPIFRGKHVGFATIGDGTVSATALTGRLLAMHSDITIFIIAIVNSHTISPLPCDFLSNALAEVIAFVDRDDSKFEELPEAVSDQLYKQFTLKKVRL
jgi:hypothetical protein